MKRFRNISTALTLVLAVSFLIICLLFSFSLSYLYGELSRQRQRELSQAAAQAAANHTATLYRQAKALVSSCANAPIAGKQPASLQNRTPKEKRAMLDLLEIMTEYCSTSAARQYVLRLAFFNENGVLVQYNPTSIRSASPEIELFLQSSPYLAMKETGMVTNMGLYPRLNQEGEWAFQYMLPVYGQTSGRVAGYLMGEFRLELFADQMPSTDSVSYALSDDKGNLLTLPAGLAETDNDLGAFLLSGQSGWFHELETCCALSALDRQTAVRHCTQAFQCIREGLRHSPVLEGALGDEEQEEVFLLQGIQAASLRQLTAWLEELRAQLLKAFENTDSLKRRDYLDLAKSYIQEHVEERLTLNDVSAAVHISPNYLSSLFMRQLSIGFVDYVNQIKMKRACELLEAGHYLIYEVANRLGYENAYYFSKVFRKYIGCTPKEYQLRSGKRNN